MVVRNTLVLAIAATALAAAGCGASGGGGGSSSSRSAATAGSGSGASTFTGVDTTKPTYTLVSPSRGGFVSGAAQQTIEGTASDTESGVARVEVNGQPATLNGSTWSIPATLDFGLNTFTLAVIDKQNDIEKTTWSAIYSPSYLPASQLVPDGAAVRLSQRAFDKITPIVISALTAGNALQTAIQNSVGSNLAGATITNLSFGTPQVAVTLAQGGFRTVIDIPNLNVSASLFGITFSLSATNAHIDATLLVSAQNGAFLATMPQQPSVTFTNPTGLVGLAGPALEAAIQSTLPPLVTRQLNQATQPQSVSLAGFTATFEGKPNTLTIDPTNFKASGDANLTITGGQNPRQGPGSISRNAGASAAPTFSTPHDVSLSLREDLLNRLMYAAWESGSSKIRIDQAFLAAQGVNLPFPLDASLLVPFFPALASLKPGGGPMPMAFEINSLLPPTIEVTGAPSLVSLGLGEQHFAIQLDLGQGYVDVLTIALHAEVGTNVTIQGNQIRILPGQPVKLAVDLLANPFGLSVPDVNAFLNTAMPLVVGLAGTLIPPVTIPPLPFGLTPTNLDIRQDGAGADFLTVEGDL